MRSHCEKKRSSFLSFQEENKPIGGFHALERSDYDDATLGRESLAIALKKDPGALSENGGHAVRRANDHAEANRPESATAEKERPATVSEPRDLFSEPKECGYDE